MIPDKIRLEILTPEKMLFTEDISSVRLPGARGYFGVFPGHTPFISVLGVGTIKVERDGKISTFATTGGVAEVLPSGVSVLAEACESGQDVDTKRAEASKERAQKRIKEGGQDWDVQRAQLALARALNRLKVSGMSG